MTPTAYINVEKRTLEFAEPIKWHTPTVANLDRIPLFTKEALAQPEQELTNIERHETNIQKFLGAPPQPEQEPVATLFGSLPVYDTTPPQRTWVGLTDEELDKIYEPHHNQYGECETPNFGYERAIEAKLKQKNGFAEEKNT